MTASGLAAWHDKTAAVERDTGIARFHQQAALWLRGVEAREAALHERVGFLEGRLTQFADDARLLSERLANATMTPEKLQELLRRFE